MANSNIILLKNVVVNYNHIQDRICMAGAFGDKGLISAWITQRLLMNFLHKLDVYIANSSANVVHSSVTEDVRKQEVTEQIEMVRDFIDELGSQSIHPLLISNIKIRKRGEHMMLVFEIQDDPRSLVLALSEPKLKKWLNILYKQCAKAGWKINVSEFNFKPS